MFDLEGTKHEKALLVMLAYIIGLTSGYIGFSFQSTLTVDEPAAVFYSINEPQESGAPDLTGYYPPVEQPPALTEEEMSTQSGEVLGDISSQGEFVVYTGDRLQVEAPTGRMVLSISQSTFEEDVPSFLSEQGTHVVPPHYVAAPDESSVFFCEASVNENECTAFIYDTKTNKIHFATLNGEKLTLTSSEAETAVWNDDKLVVANYTADLDAPWEFGLAE